MNIKNIKKNFSKWNKKTTVTIGNNREYKITGCGPDAFKVLVFEPQPELGGHPGWSQKFWPYKSIKPNMTSYKVIEKMEIIMSGQTTL